MAGDRLRRRTVLAGLLLPLAAPRRAAPAPDPGVLRTLPPATAQVLMVVSDGPAATTAALQAYARDGYGWQRALPPMTTRLGSRGLSATKREGDRTTPAGVFGFGPTVYGIGADPGVRYTYHHLVAGDWWNENSASPGYNTFAHGTDPGGPSEALWRISPQYTHFAVVQYNVPAVPGRGSGIFLHQAGAGATAGCVSLPAADLVTVLRWLEPAAFPRIVLSPAQWLDRY
ncbi:L,D-transpeptidase family protein [Dactylosporangium salmoneum]|uniref:L,D-transpeptidase family protein n=1 Tax=Dactylosporangium salmoneum TaxID=53361 RepID=UPI0031DE3EE3